MSRRNTRQGKARRRGERDRGQVTEREGDPHPGPGPAGLGAPTAPRPDGSGPRNSDEHGSGLRSDVGGRLIAVDLGEAGLDKDADLENADLDDFGDLNPDDADLQAVLAEEDLVEADLGDACDAREVADDLVGDVDVAEVPDGPSTRRTPILASRPGRQGRGPGAAGARVVKLSPDGGERGRGDLRLR